MFLLLSRLEYLFCPSGFSSDITSERPFIPHFGLGASSVLPQLCAGGSASLSAGVPSCREPLSSALLKGELSFLRGPL